MSLRYFKKAILSQNVLRDRHGKQLPWVAVPGNNGILALDLDNPAHVELAQDLDAAKGTRGIVEISASLYEALKKNLQGIKSAPKLSSLGGPIRVHRNPMPQPKQVVAPPVVAAVKLEVEAQVKAAMESAKLAGGDAALAEAATPPEKAKPRVGRPRKARVDETGPTPMPLMPGETKEHNHYAMA